MPQPQPSLCVYLRLYSCEKKKLVRPPSEMLMELQTTERRVPTQISNGRSCDLCEPVFLRGTDDRTNDLSVVTQRVRGCDMTRSERQLEIPWYSQWSSHHTALYKEGKLLLYDRLKSWYPLKHSDKLCMWFTETGIKYQPCCRKLDYNAIADSFL